MVCRSLSLSLHLGVVQSALGLGLSLFRLGVVPSAEAVAVYSVLLLPASCGRGKKGKLEEEQKKSKLAVGAKVRAKLNTVRANFIGKAEHKVIQSHIVTVRL